MRNCTCVKRLLRCCGIDEFDDFELMVLVHEATFEGKQKYNTKVRITAGAHSVCTDSSSRAIFQQPLHVTVEQGTQIVKVDLVDATKHDRVLATMSLDVMNHILTDQTAHSEASYNLSTQSKGIIKPKVKLTMVIDHEDDAERGLLTGVRTCGTDVDILVRQQLQKAKQEGVAAHGEDKLTEMEVLKEACAGPLELFEGLGKTNNVYVAVLGPPETRRWVFGIWKDKKDFFAKKPAHQEIDMLKIETVQGDPSRHHVFVINCFDGSRNHKSLTFRRIDRARDVWVEIIHLLVVKARQAHKQRKDNKTMRLTGVQSTSLAAASRPSGRF